MDKDDLANITYWEGAMQADISKLRNLIPLPENTFKTKEILKTKHSLKKSFKNYLFYLVKHWHEIPNSGYLNLKKKEAQKVIIDKENTPTNNISLPEEKVITTTTETPRERLARIRKERGIE